MQLKSKHGVDRELDKYNSSFINITLKVLNSQTTGAVWMAQKILETVPSPAYPNKEQDLQTVMKARTYRGILCDTMGMGKTPILVP